MTRDALRQLSGKFIVFDGPDGCGKTTQMKALISKLTAADQKTRRLREPGGTPIGEQIRNLLLSTKSEMDVHCEMLLYMASRAQLVRKEIIPALAAGECVLSDRFASSTLAYQGGGGGLDLQEILSVAKSAIGDTWPHLTIIFDLDIDEAMARLNPLWSAKSGGHRKGHEGQEALFQDDDVKDRIEQRDREYFQRVRENYLWQANQWPERYRIVDASRRIAEVEREVLEKLEEFFG